MINEQRINELYLEAIAFVMTAAARAVDAHGALRDHEAVDPGGSHGAAIQQYQDCLDALVEAVHNYEKIATVQAVLAQIDAEG